MSFEQDEDDQYGQSYEDGTYQKTFAFEEEGPDDMLEQKPKIFIMGQRRCGKSSIEKVVFRKMSPNETLFLASTTKVSKIDVSNSSLVNFQIWDFPGQCDLIDLDDDCEVLFRGCGAVVFVIDAQDNFMDPLNKLNAAVTKAFKVSPGIRFEVFIHKVDGLTEDSKIDVQQEIIQRATNDLADSGFDQIHLSFHLTSIYDHSIFEAFSKVVQKLIPDLAILENSINDLILKSGIEKAFLFDVRSKIYIATDPSPVDMQIYELCCDMIDVVIDISGIYGIEDNTESCAFDDHSSSLIRLNNGTVLHLRQISHFLALVCILRDDNFDRGTIDYNVLCFRKSFQQVFEDSFKPLFNNINHNSVGSST